MRGTEHTALSSISSNPVSGQLSYSRHSGMDGDKRVPLNWLAEGRPGAKPARRAFGARTFFALTTKESLVNDLIQYCQAAQMKTLEDPKRAEGLKDLGQMVAELKD